MASQFLTQLFSRALLVISAAFLPLVEIGHRLSLAASLKSIDTGRVDLNTQNKLAYVKDLKTRPIAVFTQDANKQHYEVPAEFYDTVMGPHKKYSCGYWPRSDTSLEASEVAALELVVTRAGITDSGMRILDMGCGWGSCSLYIASRFPRNTVLGVSNSASQRAYILDQAAKRGLTNIDVKTSDINTFETDKGAFDRVVSIEMMEHTKNWEALLAKVASWLKPGGRFFMHVFSHHSFPFHYETGWMAETFFTGGQMPSDDLPLYFQRDLRLEDHWVIDGMHYSKTLEAWLSKFDSEKARAWPILVSTYGRDQALKWLVNWRLFFIACSELFAFRGGQEWGVSHYLFSKPSAKP